MRYGYEPMDDMYDCINTFLKTNPFADLFTIISDITEENYERKDYNFEIEKENNRLKNELREIKNKISTLI